MIICTTVNDSMKFEIFSKAKYLVLMNENGEIIEKRNNPALNSPIKRPAVAKECVELKASTVIAPHGSLCFPSYRILKKAGVKILIANPGEDLRSSNLKEVNMKEVIYSSFLAMKERITEH
ncbi:MAG: hypothetical protein OWQ50_00815 [Acidianus infernus]|nr:hypothetical protein [Acidianus infernus]